MNKLKMVAMVSLLALSSSAMALDFTPPPDNRTDLEKSYDYTNEQVAGAKHYSDKNRDEARAGIAGVAAMSNIPTVPGKTFSAGVAVGGFQGEKALAAGVTFVPDDVAAFKASVAATSEDVVFGTGVAFGF